MASVPSSSSRRMSTANLPASDRRPQTVLAHAAVGLIALLAITGAYVAGPARWQMNRSAAMVLLSHSAVGLLSVPVLLWASVRYGLIMRTGSSPPNESFSAADWSLRAGWLLLPLAFLTGVCLIVVAARGHVAGSWLAASHVAAGFVVVCLLLAGSIRRPPEVGYERPAAESQTADAATPDLTHRSGPRVVRRIRPQAALAAASVLFLLAASGAAIAPRASLEDRYQPDAYYGNMTVTNARQARNPLFPAGAMVTVDSRAALRSSAYCGQSGCHPQVYRAWEKSPHHRAAGTAGFQHLVGRYVEQRGSSARRWCDGCHGPARLVAEKLSPDLTLDTARAAATEEGVSCVACHGMERVAELTGNGRMEIRLPEEYPFADSADPRLRWLHRFLIRLRPGPHRRAFFKPDLHPRSEACAPCHRTSYNLPQNGYKFLRTADDYGTWLAGPDSGQSVHGFLPPGATRRCQDCHDPHSGGIQAWAPRIGRRSGFQTEPLEQPRTRTPVLRNTPITLDLLALRRQTQAPGAAEELIAPLDRAAPLLQPGETVMIDLVVRNRDVGHAFPGGTGDLRGGWVELEVLGASGRRLLRSGSPGPLGGTDGEFGPHRSGVAALACLRDPGEHTYGLIALDRDGHRLEQGQLWQMVTPLYHRTILPGQPDLDRRTIQPGESDVVRYRLRVPAASGGRIELRARLWYGPLTPTAALLDPTAVVRLVAQDSVTLPVAAARESKSASAPSKRANAGEISRGENRSVQVIRSGTREAGVGHQVIRSSPPAPGRMDRALPERFYDYGVGLLLQGDLPRARRAMRRVQVWAPIDGRGYFGMGRVYLTEGDLLAARDEFERARRLAPDDPRPRAFLALIERRMGQYDRALQLLLPLAREYPRDRLLWFDIGMSYYLAGRYEEGATAFEAMLGIDPDDLAGHYNRMRCLRRLRRVAEAQQEEVVYQALREDDGAKQIALSFLRRHPWADRETRTIHEHSLYAPEGGR